MMTRTAMLFCLLLMMAMGCQSSSPQRTKTEVDKTLLGYFSVRCNCDIPPALPTLRAVTGGQSFRVRLPRDKDLIQSPRPASIREYPIVSRGPDLSASVADRLATLLTDPRAFGYRSFCGLDPGYAFTLTASNGQVVTVLICLKCGDWTAWLNEDKQIGGGGFTGMERELIALLREIFPADAPLQSYDFRNRPARVYHVQALASPATKRLPEDQRQAVRERVTRQLLEMPGFAREWQENLGKASHAPTVDGCGYIIQTKPEHHAAIEALPGFKRVYPKD